MMGLKKQGGEGGSGKKPRKTNRHRTQTTARGKTLGGKGGAGGNGKIPNQRDGK